MNYRAIDRIDSVGVREAIERYVGALDWRDWETVRSGFHEHSVSYYNGDPTPLSGPSAVLEFLGRLSHFTTTTHLVAHAQIEVDGDHARAAWKAVALLQAEGKVTVRSVRFDDAYVYDGERWLVMTRTHTPEFQVDAPAVGVAF